MEHSPSNYYQTFGFDISINSLPLASRGGKIEECRWWIISVDLWWIGRNLRSEWSVKATRVEVSVFWDHCRSSPIPSLPSASVNSFLNTLIFCGNRNRCSKEDGSETAGHGVGGGFNVSNRMLFERFSVGAYPEVRSEMLNSFSELKKISFIRDIPQMSFSLPPSKPQSPSHGTATSQPFIRVAV